ncbi:hypothetical protein MPLSOD_10446 [Mesorhizobium sp. SOD10]|nr:hypothetical protein MPLSOD_10446 [Mesorhizobium sp. SOD10]
MLSFLLLTARWQFASRKDDHQENQIPDPGDARNLISHGRPRPLITLAYQRRLEITFPLRHVEDPAAFGTTAAPMTWVALERQEKSASLNSSPACHKRRKFSTGLRLQR